MNLGLTDAGGSSEAVWVVSRFVFVLVGGSDVELWLGSAHLWVDEAYRGFRPDILLVAAGGRRVEAQHGIVSVCD